VRLARLYPEHIAARLREQEAREQGRKNVAGRRAMRVASWWHVITQVGRFGIVGIVNTVLDLCLFNALLWLFPTHSAVLLLVYNTIAYAVGAIDSFLLNKYWTFQRKHAVTRKEIVRFILTTGVGVICSDLILWIAGMLLSHTGGNAILLSNLAKLLAVAGTCSVSYLGMHLWVFVRRSEH
jgi:putative flippase GtrA